ncbi:SPFH domain-containing protein [Streptomyces sp. NPDC050504]|uniref:SPFH domain-containing protein n=1 Tax=Streptomyces sp. NPDC050504 TaxID=3365618 RepID=UPI0037910184
MDQTERADGTPGEDGVTGEAGQAGEAGAGRPERPDRAARPVRTGPAGPPNPGAAAGPAVPQGREEAAVEPAAPVPRPAAVPSATVAGPAGAPEAEAVRADGPVAEPAPAVAAGAAVSSGTASGAVPSGAVASGVVASSAAAPGGAVPGASASGGSASGGAVPPGARRGSVIANEVTSAIPVHLLFRDDAGPAPRPAARPPAARRPVSAPPAAPARPAPVGDPAIAERRGPVVAGWIAALVGLAGLAAIAGVLWRVGAAPGELLKGLGARTYPYHGIGLGWWALLALLVTVVLFALGGLGRGRVGYAWVLTLFGDYRGSVRRTGLVWVSPLLLRRRVDVRLRHWRSEPLPAVDSCGTALRVVVLVVWRMRDTARAVLGVADHEAYLREQVEAAMARVLSQLPADAFHEDAPTLRNAEAVGDALTRLLRSEGEAAGIEVFSAQPTRIEYAPEVAAAMQRRRVAAIDAKHRDSVLTSVVDAVDDTVHRLTSRGLVELDDYERKALVKDLTVAFYTGRAGGVEAP